MQLRPSNETTLTGDLVQNGGCHMSWGWRKGSILPSRPSLTVKTLNSPRGKDRRHFKKPDRPTACAAHLCRKASQPSPACRKRTTDVTPKGPTELNPHALETTQARPSAHDKLSPTDPEPGRRDPRRDHLLSHGEAAAMPLDTFLSPAIWQK
ncbi:Hypothetical predicted protein [Pelobates cultripes]|uniref:Uncharacterized protein n=1 Tax=Pelobates cultripes TaxID=61616 RepID=A0AAD1WFL5_PELCU|nr:Hypothetical predicted protein [Pelobates cultripes]